MSNFEMIKSYKTQVNCVHLNMILNCILHRGFFHLYSVVFGIIGVFLLLSRYSIYCINVRLCLFQNDFMAIPLLTLKQLGQFFQSYIVFTNTRGPSTDVYGT